MFATSFPLLEGGISKRVVNGFGGVKDDAMTVGSSREWLGPTVVRQVRLGCMPVFAQAHEVDTWGHGHTRRFYAAASGCSQFKVTVIIKGFGESLTMDPTISIPYCIHYALDGTLLVLVLIVPTFARGLHQV